MSTPLLSAKLIELRQYFGYSQQEIADYLGLTREAYSHYERSAREPSLETLVKLSKLYQIDISELINEKTVLSSEILSIQNIATCGSAKDTVKSDICGMASIAPPTPFLLIPTVITNNLIHLLKILSGKNSNLELNNISKEDIAVLAQYKKLSKQDQKEVRQFIKFKLSTSKRKE